MRRRRSSLLLILAGTGTLLGGCTGLIAGPEVAASTPVPASRDSAYTRARRGLTAESFTMDVVDSVHGRLTGTRFPSQNAKLGAAASCRVLLAMEVQGSGEAAEVNTTTRWVAPKEMADAAGQVCEEERMEVLERLTLTLAPPAP